VPIEIKNRPSPQPATCSVDEALGLKDRGCDTLFARQGCCTLRGGGQMNRSTGGTGGGTEQTPRDCTRCLEARHKYVIARATA
jgi:hypothetical protein